MNAGPILPNVSSTVDMSAALTQMHKLRRPELSTMDEETSLEGRFLSL